MSDLHLQEHTDLISASLNRASAAFSLSLQRVAAFTPYAAEKRIDRVVLVDTDRVQKLSPTTANKNAVIYLKVVRRLRAQYWPNTTALKTASQMRAIWLDGGALAEYECICCRDTLTASAACVMNCCAHLCNEDGECQEPGQNKTRCRHLCIQDCDQVWCEACLRKVIDDATMSTLSFPPRPGKTLGIFSVAFPIY